MMKKRDYGLYAVAAAIVVVGALWLEVPLASLGVFAVVLACPLMMLFMMGGMRGMHGGDSDRNDAHGTPDDRSSRHR